MGTKTLKVGAAETNIDPKPGTQLAGWLDVDRPCDTFLDPLSARAVVIDNGEAVVALVGLDLLSLRWTQVNAIRRRAAETTAIPAENILIASSHTHCGPATATLSPILRDEPYIETLVERVTATIGEAFANRRPARIGIASGFEGRLSFNRRYITKAGGTLTHPPTASPMLSHVEGPIDPEVGVLCARDAEGKTIANVVNFACHPTHHGGGTIVSADFPGELARLRKAIDGPQCVTVFLNGAFGNLHHNNPMDPACNEQDTPHRMAKALSDDMSKIIEGMSFEVNVVLRVASRTLEFPLKKVPEEMVARAREVLAGPVELSAEPVHIDRVMARWGGASERFTPHPYYAERVLALYERARKRPFSRGEIQVIRIGETAIVSNPAEMFCQIALAIKLASPARLTYIAGNANGVLGYMPNRGAFELPMQPGTGPCYGTKGDYETRPVPWARVAPEAADMSIAASLDLIKECFPDT